MFSTSLFDETTFYQQFSKDLDKARTEAIIESPFITLARVNKLSRVFEMLVNRGIRVYVITRLPNNHDEFMRGQAEQAIQYFESLGIQVFVTKNNHHRKLAIIDRQVLWEGSLNILSQTKSREVMRRIKGYAHAQEMFDFLNLDKFIKSSEPPLCNILGPMVNSIR